MEQLSFLDVMIPPPAPVKWQPPPTRQVITRAYGVQAQMEIGLKERDPIEIEVRGVLTLIRFHFAFQTIAVEGAGSLYWSETGYRSFAGLHVFGGSNEYQSDEIRQFIEAHIDSKDGCKGKLTKWWPSYCLQWRKRREFAQGVKRSETWAQWGPEQHEAHWAEFDAEQLAAFMRMDEEGIDPEEVWRSR